MKEKDRPNFILNDQFGDIILNSQYIIQKDQLFYISKSTKRDKQSGILDMEYLMEEFKDKH